MIQRTLGQTLLEHLNFFPAVALLGPRQVGKTTLARTLSAAGGPSIYVDLESRADRNRVAADPELFLKEHEDVLVVLDEIQRIPEIFASMRGAIDRRRFKGQRSRQYLILGSASHDLLRQTSESLAGRIVYVELAPLHLLETAPDSSLALWQRGGFPESFLAPNDKASFHWRTAFVRSYVERDIPALGPRIPAEKLYRFWRMLAHSQGQLLNAQRLAGSLGISGATVSRYLDMMVDLMLVRRLQPWHANGTKRLVRAPKVYVRDSGILHALLDIPDREALLGHPVAGSSWEGFVIENILAATEFRHRASFYRTVVGAEIDLVLEVGHDKRYAIEVKRSISDPRPEKGFHIGCDDIEATHRYVVYPGEERYQLSKDVTVTPLFDLLRELAPQKPLS